MSAEQQAPGRDITTWLGLAVVGAAAAVLSFSALSDLGHLSGLTGELEVDGRTLRAAWLLPVTVDVLAAVATRIWLQRRVGLEAAAFARRAAWAAIAATVVGNGYHGALIRAGAEPPLIVAIIVGAVPAVVLGGLVHLAVLVRRPPGEPGGEQAAGLDRWARVARLWRLNCALWRVPFALLPNRRREQSGAGGDQSDRVPTRADSNAALAADLRRLDAARQAEGLKPLPRDEIRVRYGVGSDRAQAVRELADATEEESAS